MTTYSRKLRSTDSWVTVSSTMEDGCAWRKYGQKDILNSKYPRCYYRCTHKYEGCKATRQVQRTKEEDSILYQITYFNQHTCTQTQLISPNSPLILDSDPLQHNLISFQTNIIPSKKIDQNPTINNISSSVKQEPKEEDHAQISEDLSEAKSTLQDPWRDDIIGLESFGYRPEWAAMEASGFQSCESTSFQYGLYDMEVNQLGDIDNLHYFDQFY